MGGGSLTAIVQELIGGVAVVVLSRKSEELSSPLSRSERFRQFDASPGASVHHVSRKVATDNNHTTESSAQICDGRYASTYQLAHCGHRPTSPELNTPEFPVQRQGPYRNEGNFEVGSSSFVRARGSSTRATSPSFRLTPWRERAYVNHPSSPPERDDAFANSLRRYPSTKELFQRFLKRQSKLLDKALRQAKSLRTLPNSKHSNICIKKSSKTVNLNRRKKEQSAAEYWRRKFVMMHTHAMKGFPGCRSSRPCCTWNIRPPEPRTYSNSPQPRPATASDDRKAVMDSIRENLRTAYGRMGGSLATYNVCPRMLDRLDKHRRDFHESEQINTGSSAKSLHRLKVQKSSDSDSSGILGRIFLGLNRSRSKIEEEKVLCECEETMQSRSKVEKEKESRSKIEEDKVLCECEKTMQSRSKVEKEKESRSKVEIEKESRSKIEKEKVICECEETMQERQKKQKTQNTCECHTGSSFEPSKCLAETCCPCAAKLCECDLGKATCECYVPVKESRAIEDWLSELPIQASEKPKDKSTRNKIIKDLFKTLTTMDDDKFNKEGLNEIKKQLHGMPMWVPKDKDRKEIFIDEISNNLFDRTKTFRNGKFRSAKGTQLAELPDELANEPLISPKEGSQPVDVMTDKLSKIHEELVLDALNEVSEFDNMSEDKKRMAAKDVIQKLSDSLIKNNDDGEIEKIDSVLRFYIVKNKLDQLLRDNTISLAPEKQRQLTKNIVRAVQAKLSGQSPDSRRGSQSRKSSINRPHAATEHLTGPFADGRPTNNHLKNSSDFRHHSDRRYSGDRQHKRHDCLNKEPSKQNIKKTATKRNLGPQYSSKTEPGSQDPRQYSTEMRPGTQDPSQHSPKMRPGTQEQRQYTPEMRPSNIDPNQYLSVTRVDNLDPNKSGTQQRDTPEIRPGNLDTSKYSYYQDAGPYTSEKQSSYKDPKYIAGNRNPYEYPSEIRTDTQDPSPYSPEMRPGAQEKIQYSPEIRPGNLNPNQYPFEIRPENLDPNHYPFEISTGTQDPRQYSLKMKPATQEPRQHTPEMRPGNLDPSNYSYNQDAGPYTSEMQSSYEDPKLTAGNRNPNQYPSEIITGTQDPRQYSPVMRPGTQEQRQYTPETRPGNLDPNQYPSEIRPENLDRNHYPSEITPGTQERDTPAIRPGNLDPSKYSYYQDAGPYTSETQSSYKDPKHTAGNRNPNQYPSEIITGTQDPRQYSPEMRPGTQEQRQYTPETRPGNLDPNQYPSSEIRPENLDRNHYPSEIRPGTQERDTPEIRPGNLDPSKYSYYQDAGPYTSETQSSYEDPKHIAGNRNPNQYPSEIRPGTQERDTSEIRPGNLERSYKDPKHNAGNRNPNQYPSEIRNGTQDPLKFPPEMRPGTQERRQYSPEIRPGNLDPNQYPSEIRPGTQERDTPEIRPGNLERSYKDPKHTAGNRNPNQYPSEIRTGTQDPRIFPPEMRPDTQERRRYSPEIRPGNLDPNQYPSEIRPGTQERDTPEIRLGNLDPSKHSYYQGAGPYTPETETSYEDPKLYADNHLNTNQYPSEIRPGTQDPSQYSREMIPGTQKKQQKKTEIGPGNLDPNQYTFEKRIDNLGPDHYPFKTRPGIQEKDIPEFRPHNLDSKQYPSDKTPEDQGPRQHSPVKRPGYSSSSVDPRQYSPAIRSGNQDPRYSPGVHFPSKPRPGSQYPGHGGRAGSPDRRPSDMEPTSPGQKNKSTLSHKEPSSTNEQLRDKTGMPNLTHGTRDKERISKESKFETAFENILTNEDSTEASVLMDLLALLEQVRNAGIQSGDFHDKLIKHINELSEYLTHNQSYQSHPHDGRPGATPEKRKTSILRYSTDEQEDPSRNRSKNIARPKSPARVTDQRNVSAGPSKSIQSPRIQSRSPPRSLEDQRRGVSPGPDVRRTSSRGRVEKEVGPTSPRERTPSPKKAMDERTLSSNLNERRMSPSSRGRVEKEVGPTSPRERTPSPKKGMDERTLSSNLNERRMSPSSRGRVEKEVGPTSPRERTSSSEKKAMDERTLSSNLNERGMSPSSTGFKNITSSKSSGRAPSTQGNSTENISSKAKTKNEHVYFKELQNNIQNWIHDLDIDLKGNERNLTIVMADEILDRQRYLNLNPNVNTSDGEELEDMKYQIFKMLKNKVDPEKIKLIMPHVNSLMGKLKDVPVPSLSYIAGKI